MKKLLILLVILVSVFGVNAQTSKLKRPPLPDNLVKMKDADSADFLNNPTIKNRLKRLLGKKSYADFLESWETLNPVEKRGNFLFSSGCMIHACTHIESAMAIDLVNQTIHVGIFRDTEKTRFFNENGGKTPLSIKNWANRLNQK